MLRIALRLPPLPRRVAALIALIALAGCGGIPRPGPAGPPRPEAAVLRQCLASLDAAGIRYTRLPDRMREHGCATIGTVQLLEIGTPVTNLGPLTCPLAGRFAGWVRDAVQPAARVWLGSEVTRIESFGSYACRPVNNRAGARISEHGYANAVDVAAFVLADGRRITVKDGWRGGSADARDFLRAVHGAACRRFAVVIGPDGDAYHQDHLHLDLGRGPYCR